MGTPNVKNFFEQADSEGNNQLICNTAVKTLNGITLNDGGAPEMQFRLVPSPAELSVSILCADSRVPGTRDTAIFGCFAGINLDENSVLNCVVGNLAAFDITTGGENCLIGNATATELKTGIRNTCVGHLAALALNSGSNNTIVGAFATNLTTVDKNVVIGFGADGGVRDDGAGEVDAESWMMIGESLFGYMDLGNYRIGGDRETILKKTVSLELDDDDKGFVLNNVSSDGSITTTYPGMIWFNTSQNELRCRLNAVGIRAITTTAV